MTRIRECTSRDFEQLIGLFRQLWPNKPINAETLRTIYERVLASRTRFYFCFESDETMIGLASLSVKDNLWQEGVVGYVDELVVDEQYRGCGIGAQLLEHLAVVAREHGCCRLELDSAFHRKEAHRFYERCGFESRAMLFSKAL